MRELNLRNTLKITILLVLFSSSTILTATKANISFISVPADQTISPMSSSAAVYVSPENTTKGLNETFTIDFIVANVTNLYGVGLEFHWDPKILEYVSHTAKLPVDDFPGGILHKPGFLFKNDVNATTGIYKLAYASLDPAPVFDGTGAAFNITFKVKKLSACVLEIIRADLSDHSGNPLPQGWTITDGYFVPAGAPEARFTWWPQVGAVGKPMVFNASESFDLGGTITEYYWNFDDKNVTATANPIIYHLFNNSGDFAVSLIVEDNTGINSTKVVGLVKVVKSRGIGILSVSLSAKSIQVNSTVYVNGTVKNTGYAVENFTLVAYYNTSVANWTMIASLDIVNLSPGEKKYSFAWNTTGIEAEKYYVVQVNATVIPYEDETDNTKTSEPVFITAKEIHNMAVETLSFQATRAGHTFSPPIILGESAKFTINVRNLGTVPQEAYNVTLYGNGTLLKQWNPPETLQAGATKTLTWRWDAISQRGQYNMTTQVTIIENDNNTQDNRLEQIMHVIEAPFLHIDYIPETPVMNQIITLNASSSTHREPEGQITSYSWEIYAPGENPAIDIPEYKSGISTSYNFTEEGNWTIVLRVTDNYGITYNRIRENNDYRLEVPLIIQSAGDGEDGAGGIPIEYIALIIVAIVVVIAVLIVIYRRRS